MAPDRGNPVTMKHHDPPSPPLGGAVLAPREVAAFRTKVYAWSRANPRSLPWRETRDPYAVIVSEVMLQQTGVERVVGKYAAFLARFPDFVALARAPLQDILAAWQGLGYNRRAVALKKCAETVLERHGGALPDSVSALQSLPGIGPYTARAVATFAFDAPTVFIETNIRAVYIHHFCGDRQKVKDAELIPLVAATLDYAAPRSWYNALMDYGVMLKKTEQNPARRSAHHVRQSPFAGSNREVRSRILKVLLASPRMTETEIVAALDADEAAIRKNLVQLAREGFIGKDRGRFEIH